MQAVHWQSDAAPVWASSVAATPSLAPLRPHSRQPGEQLLLLHCLHWGIVVAIVQHWRCLYCCQVSLRHCCSSAPPRHASVVSEKARDTFVNKYIYISSIKIYKYNICGAVAYSQVLLRGLLQECLVVRRLLHLALRKFTQLRR